MEFIPILPILASYDNFYDTTAIKALELRLREIKTFLPHAIEQSQDSKLDAALRALAEFLKE